MRLFLPKLFLTSVVVGFLVIAFIRQFRKTGTHFFDELFWAIKRSVWGAEQIRLWGKLRYPPTEIERAFFRERSKVL